MGTSRLRTCWTLVQYDPQVRFRFALLYSLRVFVTMQMTHTTKLCRQLQMSDDCLMCAHLETIRRSLYATEYLLNLCEIGAWTLVVPILFADTALPSQDRRPFDIYSNEDGSSSCFCRFGAPCGLPSGFVATRSLTDTLVPINNVSMMWAWIKKFLWVGGVLNT